MKVRPPRNESPTHPPRDDIASQTVRLHLDHSGYRHRSRHRSGPTPVPTMPRSWQRSWFPTAGNPAAGRVGTIGPIRHTAGLACGNSDEFTRGGDCDVRRLTGLALLTMLALLLAACGGDSGDDEPTEVSQPTQGATATEAGPEPTTPAATESTPDASPVTIATPGAATPVETLPLRRPHPPRSSPRLRPVRPRALSPNPEARSQAPPRPATAREALVPKSWSERFPAWNRQRTVRDQRRWLHWPG